VTSRGALGSADSRRPQGTDDEPLGPCTHDVALLAAKTDYLMPRGLGRQAKATIMSFNSIQTTHQLRQDSERLLEVVTGPEAHSATIGQMERFLFRQILRMG